MRARTRVKYTRHASIVICSSVQHRYSRGNTRDKEWNRWREVVGEGGMPLDHQWHGRGGVSSRCVYAGDYLRKRARVCHEWETRTCVFL